MWSDSKFHHFGCRTRQVALKSQNWWCIAAQKRKDWTMQNVNELGAEWGVPGREGVHFSEGALTWCIWPTRICQNLSDGEFKLCESNLSQSLLLPRNLNCYNLIFLLKLKFIRVFLKSIMYQGRFCENFALFQGSQPVDGAGEKYSRKLASSTCGE